MNPRSSDLGSSAVALNYPLARFGVAVLINGETKTLWPITRLYYECYMVPVEQTIVCPHAESIPCRHIFPYYCYNAVIGFCRWYFALISLSGVFAVTFSVVFAYVADITTEEERSSAYGLVGFMLISIKWLASLHDLVLLSK